MFEILDTALFSLMFRIIMLVIAGGGFMFFAKRAIEQLKSTKTVLSIVDEIIICFLIIVGAIIIIGVKPSIVVGFFVVPLMWIWQGILELARMIGVPI
ncbi:MAG: hypothetical protein ACRCZK_03655 [Oscillospiraceae bacterium]